MWDLGRYQEALDCLQRFVEIDPTDGAAWNLRGHILHKMSRIEEADQSYDNAIKINQNDFMAWNNKGRVMHQLGKYKEAIDCYDKALQINPNIGQIWFNKGESIEKMKNGGFGKFFKFGKNESKKCFDKAMELDQNCR